MPQQLNDPVFIAFAGGTLVLSAVTGVLLLTTALARGRILQFQPRRLVPWNVVGGLMAYTLVILTILSVLEKRREPQTEKQTPGVSQDAAAKKPRVAEHDAKEPKLDAADLVTALAVSMVPQALLVGGMLWFIVFYFKATPRDLGLPLSANELAHDVAIGLIAGLAALAPIHLIQAGLMHLFFGSDVQSGHPLVKMLTASEPSAWVMLVATIVAVVVAPICEEITFRLLLQGWLERWEAEEVTNSTDVVPISSEVKLVPAREGNQMTNDECRMSNDDSNRGPNDSSFDIRHSSLSAPPPRGLAGLPFGCVPIMISSFLFGLAHFGYGPEPIPLFLLAIVLGYVYYRTHRIVPCIVAHAFFNLFTMVVLWRLVFQGAE